jgi:carbon-monoxide dehydrogenase medium subunit
LVRNSATTPRTLKFIETEDIGGLILIERISHINLPEFEIKTPNSLDEALHLLSTYQTNCKVLAGGTDLLVDLRHRLIKPTVVIDIKNIPELQQLEFTNKGFEIGAAVSISRVLSYFGLKSKYPALFQALSDMCDEILRHRATIGGNIATASPAADTAGPLLVYQADVEIRSHSKKTRNVPIYKFFTGVKTCNLNSDELITKITLPIPSETEKSAFLKMKRGVEDLALVGVTGLHDQNFTRLAFTSVAPIPVILDISEIIPNGSSTITEKSFQVIWEKVLTKINPITDVRSSREYRLHITEILTRMILKEIF